MYAQTIFDIRLTLIQLFDTRNVDGILFHVRRPRTFNQKLLLIFKPGIPVHSLFYLIMYKSNQIEIIWVGVYQNSMAFSMVKFNFKIKSDCVDQKKKRIHNEEIKWNMQHIRLNNTLFTFFMWNSEYFDSEICYKLVIFFVNLLNFLISWKKT